MWQKFRAWPNGGQIAVWVVLGIVVFSIIGAVAGGNKDSGSPSSAESSRSSSGSGGGEADETKAAPSEDAGSNIATDDYTPHVNQGTPVVVDELTWRIRGASASKNLGDNDFTNATANGVFVVVQMTVKNGKSKSATVNSSMVTLVVGGKEYDSDTEGEMALIGSSQKSFFLEDIGPDLSQDGTVVFDVPASAVSAKPEICVGELGFGPSRGCIALTRLS